MPARSLSLRRGSAKTLSAAIGKKALWRVEEGGLGFNIVVEDVRQVDGELQYLVASYDGVGISWVTADRLRFDQIIKGGFVVQVK